MVLELLTQILVWAAVGLIVWYMLLKFIPRNFLTWFGGAILLTLVIASFVAPTDEAIGAIWRIISLPLTPLGFSLGLLLFSFKDLPFKEGFKVSQGRYVASAFLILLVCSSPLVARFFINQAEQAVQNAYDAQRGICADVCPVEIPTDIPLSRVSAMVVIGENADIVSPLDELPDQADNVERFEPVLVSRLSSAATLYSRLVSSGSNPFVIVTAGPVFAEDEDEIRIEENLRGVLIRNGVPGDAIVIEDAGTDVHKAMRQTQSFLEDRGLLSDPDTPQRSASRVALVAPAVSMRRAALTFEEEGIDVIAWPTNLYGGSGELTGDTLARLSDLVPSAEALLITSRYWNEVLTSFYYFLRGWLPGFDVRWNEVVEIVRE